MQREWDWKVWVKSDPSKAIHVDDCDDGSCQEGKGHGCFFWWCMGCLWFGVLIFLIMLWGIWFWYHKLWWIIVDWTSESPMELPERVVPDNAEALIQQFGDTEKKWEAWESDSLTIDQETINALLSSGDMYKYIDIDLGTGDVITFMVSAPLDGLNRSKVKGRYFNLILWASYKYDHGGTEAYIRRLEIPGKDIPSVFTDEFIWKDLWPYFYKDEDYAKNMQKFESIILSGGKLYVKMKGSGE